MRTPVSALDAKLKKADIDCLEYDIETGMYFIKRNPDKACIFFDILTERCSLPLEKRFNSCLVYPVRLYIDKKDYEVYVILNKTCPSALSLFDMYSRREPSAVNYIKTATKIIMADAEYRNHVLEKTKDFTEILRIGTLRDVLGGEAFCGWQSLEQ